MQAPLPCTTDKPCPNARTRVNTHVGKAGLVKLGAQGAVCVAATSRHPTPLGLFPFFVCACVVQCVLCIEMPVHVYMCVPVCVSGSVRMCMRIRIPVHVCGRVRAHLCMHVRL